MAGPVPRYAPTITMNSLHGVLNHITTSTQRKHPFALARISKHIKNERNARRAETINKLNRLRKATRTKKIRENMYLVKFQGLSYGECTWER